MAGGKRKIILTHLTKAQKAEREAEHEYRLADAAFPPRRPIVIDPIPRKTPNYQPGTRSGGTQKPYGYSSTSRGVVYTPISGSAAASKNYSTFKKGYEHASPDAKAVLDMVTDPETCTPIRWPNTYGLSSVYKAKNVFNANFTDDAAGVHEPGASIVAVYPRLTNAIFATRAGGAYTLTLNGIGSGTNPFSNQGEVTIAAGSVQPWTAPIFTQTSSVVLPFANAAVPNKMLYPIGSTSNVAGDSAVTIRMSNTYTQQVFFTVHRYDSAFALLSSSAVTNVPVAGSINVTFTPATTPTHVYSAFEISCQGSPYKGDATITFHTGNAPVPNFAIADSPYSCNVIPLKDADQIIAEAECAFVSAQSLLITYQGSTLNDNGSLAIARVPGSTIIGDKQNQAEGWYDFIADLPQNNYDGPTKHGGYAFNMGSSEEFYFYRPVEFNAPSTQPFPYLVSAFTADASAGVVRIRVVTVIQFQSNSNVYEQQISPYIGDERKIKYLLSVINASYANDGHEKAMSYLKSAGDAALKLLKNPKTWATAAEIGAMLLL